MKIKSENSKSIILGVDPGSVICGYGVICKDGSKLSLVEYGVIKAKLKNEVFNERLAHIHNRLNEVILRTGAKIASFETIFFSKNVQSLIKLSHARSAAILSATLNQLEIFEYSANEVKRSVSGRGQASKEQVQFMVKRILNIEETQEFFDATDALAIAICHSYKNQVNSKSPASWKDFVKENPNRIVK